MTEAGDAPPEAEGSIPEAGEALEGPERRPPTWRRLTDLGNAERLVEAHGEDIRWVTDREEWRVWSGSVTETVCPPGGGCWVPDRHRQVRRWTQNRIRQISAEAQELREKAAAEPEGERRTEIEKLAKATAKWGAASEQSARISAAMLEASARPGVALPNAAWDQNPDIFVWANGTVDLGPEGELSLRPSRREDFSTRSSPVSVDPAATCPRWDAFLLWAMEDSPEMVAYLARIIGYAIYGGIADHAFFMFYGKKGRNGKGTFLNVVQELFGPYACGMPPNLLIAQRTQIAERHPTELAYLAHGVRLAVSSEVNPGVQWDVAKLKSLTGGDRITARGMGQDFETTPPAARLILSAQELPKVSADDQGFWRRMQVCPWNRQVSAEEEDTNLLRHLLAELPGIANWALRGYSDWRAQGLNPPARVLEETAAYRGAQDTMGQFLEENCVLDEFHRETIADVYATYTAWARESGYLPIAKNRFSSAMITRGIAVVVSKDPSRKSVRMLVGLELIK